MLIERIKEAFQVGNIHKLENGIKYRIYCEPLWEDFIVVQNENELYLQFRAENAEDFESYFNQICMDLKNPQLIKDLWNSDNELWIRFNFCWEDEQAEFENFLKPFKRFI